MFDANAYFKTLAERHQDILHVDGTHERFFIQHSTSTMLLHQSKMKDRLRNLSGNVLVSQFNGSEDVIGNSIHNANASVTGYLYFMQKVQFQNFDQVEAAQKNLKEIWLDFRTQIQTDMQADQYTFPRFKLQRVTQRPMGILMSDFVALMVMMSYEEARCYRTRNKFNPAP